MRNRLVQRDKFFNKRTFELTENGLRGQHKGLFYSNEYSIDYDEIGTRILKENVGRNGWLATATIGAVLSAFLFARRFFGGEEGSGAEIFYLLIAAVCGLVFIITYKRKFYLVKSPNLNAIEFFYNNPSKIELDDFINTLKARRNQVLEEKYGRINTMLSYEQNHQNLMWLLNNDVITKEAFDSRSIELDSKFKSSVGRRIGFNLGEN